MRTISFKSGKTLSVPQNIVNILNEQILKGTKTFQTFSDEKGECFLIINVSEIDFIA